MTIRCLESQLWTGSNFITSRLETGRDSWNKPFLITYLNTSAFTFYLIPTWWRYRRTRSSQYQPLSQTDIPSSRTVSLTRSSYERIRTSDEISRRSTSLTRGIPTSPRVPLHEISSLHETAQFEDKLSVKETAKVAAWWSAVWFIANLAVNASLAWTSVASVTILSSTSGFFTLALGALCRVEVLNNIKFSAVLMSFVGVVLVTRADSSSHNAADVDVPAHPVLGDLAALLSASFYAVYVVLLKVRVGNEDRADMQMLLGFAGLFNTLLLIPIFPILHVSGWETFELPPSREAWTICAINMGITLSSDYIYVLAMLKTTPMVATVGLSLTIPMALVGSLVLYGPTYHIPLMVFMGALLVLAGFGQLGYEGWAEAKRQALSNLADEDGEIEAEAL
ncbi:hypothetical protein M231_01367 [Tremella mesenterica]|uniref:Solute carrier family 35, member F5 n=1 Tax=Tremella mesenterica TaxID=5217 RepID=A0A4V1M4Q8_TREME|nr:hypothetical protein M231_01367 [Tremella mesenterica]